MTDIVRGVMAEEGLYTDCVPNMYRIQDVFGTSRCYCARCSRVWTSHMTWVKFDLRSQRILKNWKQLCVVCNTSVNPYINSEELERMARLAVERCVALANGTFVLRSSQRRSPPHNVMACEKCREGGRPCWVIKQKDKTSPCPSESGASQDSSDLDTINDDLSKLMLTSAESSLTNSRAPSPRTSERLPHRPPLMTPCVTPSYAPNLAAPGYYPPPSGFTVPAFQQGMQFCPSGPVFFQSSVPPQLIPAAGPPQLFYY